MFIVNGDNYDIEILVFICTVNVFSIGDFYNIGILSYIGDIYDTEIFVLIGTVIVFSVGDILDVRYLKLSR